jgi:hypothetical protein
MHARSIDDESLEDVGWKIDLNFDNSRDFDICLDY